MTGIRLESASSEVIRANNSDMMAVSSENWYPEEYIEEYVDDVSGQYLNTKMMKSARGDEMKKFAQHSLYT